MSASPTSSPSPRSLSLRSNFMNALTNSGLSSPESSPKQSGGASFTIEMSDLMLPSSVLEGDLFGVPRDCEATVVSTSSGEEFSPSVAPTTSSSSSRKRKSSASLPSSLLLSKTANGDSVTSPVPEFLCHLFSMLTDPSYADLISWEVPIEDEPDQLGGGIRGMGKIVVHRPEELQDSVLGKYYRHSKYASFQRQLNYFGFKKRLHGGKKGKLSPCSYIHEALNEDVNSLFTLKRRPPAAKKQDVDSASSISSIDDTTTVASGRSTKKRRVIVEKKSPTKKSSSKKDKKRKSNKKQVVVTSVPLQVKAEEYGPPSSQSCSDNESYQYQAPRTVSPGGYMRRASEPTHSNTTVIKQQRRASLPQPTLLELLSTTLPPSDILFNDVLDMDSVDDDGAPAWVTDDGSYHYHNVDSSLVDLAMLY